MKQGAVRVLFFWEIGQNAASEFKNSAKRETVKYRNKKAQDVVSCAFSVYGFDFRKGGATGRT